MNVLLPVVHGMKHACMCLHGCLKQGQGGGCLMRACTRLQVLTHYQEWRGKLVLVQVTSAPR
jgi:hypothetical protein